MSRFAISSSLRFGSCLALVAFVLASTASAADVVMIEEHWQLSVGGPDPGSSSPQVTMVMSPFGHLDNEYFLVTLNHSTEPDFSPGGIQVQQWYGENSESSTQVGSHSPLSADGEVINWVQRLSIVGGVLRFEATGNSSSLGTFGSNGELQLNQATTLTKLNTYQPSISLNHSGIGYAGNRVSSLTLQRLRWVTSDGNEHELVAPIDIDTDIDP